MSTMGRTAAGIVSFALWAGLMASSGAQTPTQLSPPASAPTPPAAKPVAKPVPSKPAATQSSKPAPTQTRPVSASPRRDLDMAYGAFQRGHYVTAFAIATQRGEEQKHVKAMTLPGELYANRLGAERDTKEPPEVDGQPGRRG